MYYIVIQEIDGDLSIERFAVLAEAEDFARDVTEETGTACLVARMLREFYPDNGFALPPQECRHGYLQY